MRGTDPRQEGMFSYVSPEARVPADHPLRAIRKMVNRALEGLTREFEEMYSH
ncbi:MAG: IS5/IS1182 family transposase, partial [Deltaproteobacteria bacterium]|nr:IS5/IS1182 family transposase [Deltaproteobacteria bacterium]